ncbi:porin [Candidatus Pelagibacter sp.]|nr:porin [Candidatus Pelagibacter sp.]
MNNLKKVGLTALAGALVSVSANALDVSVSGGASISFSGEEKQTSGNGWSMNDGITFSSSGEMDNGMTVTVTQILNNDDVASDRVFDTSSLSIDMGDSGTLTFIGTGGSSILGAIDDTTPTANEESWDDVTGADTIPGGVAGNDMFEYSNSSLMDGLTLSASYVPSDGSSEVESSMDYAFAYTGVEGLTIGAGKGDHNTSATAGSDITQMYAKYTMDAISVGVHMSEDDSETASSDLDFTAYGISYAVSEDMSVSLNTSTIEYENSTLSDQEATGVSLSYTMGSMTLSGNMNSVDNIAGVATDDRSGYSFTLGFAF